MWLVTGAQQNHFIYLQTENKQAFYVKLDKKILSSSASGYLIIPKLLDGMHMFTLGFPKNEWPEQSVTCVIDKKDAGYILKNFGDKGWGLFSWQSLNVVMASIKKEEETPVVAVKKTEPEKIKEQPVTENITQKKNSIPVTAAATKAGDTATAAAKMEEPLKPANAVLKLLSIKTSTGIEMIFNDVANGNNDTIRVFFPVEQKENEQPASNTQELKQPDINEEKTAGVKTVETVISQPEEIKVPEKNTKAPQQIAVIKENIPEQTPLSKKTIIQNSDCKAFADEDDFMKLRKKMAAENTDDDMVNAARKGFKLKCFTVEQIKNLSVLFLNDNGRYKFFDAAYPFISDTYNFSSLQKLLTDDYYINRFKAMLRQ